MFRSLANYGGVAQSVRVRGVAGVRVRVPPPPIKKGNKMIKNEMAALKIEVKRLKTENARLRSLLGAREKRAGRNKTPLAKAILKAFEGKETLMIGGIVRSVSETLKKPVKKSTVYQSLYRLQKAGIIEQVKKGVYALKGE